VTPRGTTRRDLLRRILSTFRVLRRCAASVTQLISRARARASMNERYIATHRNTHRGVTLLRLSDFPFSGRASLFLSRCAAPSPIRDRQFRRFLLDLQPRRIGAKCRRVRKGREIGAFFYENPFASRVIITVHLQLRTSLGRCSCEKSSR